MDSVSLRFRPAAGGSIEPDVLESLLEGPTDPTTSESGIDYRFDVWGATRLGRRSDRTPHLRSIFFTEYATMPLVRNACEIAS